MTTKYQTIDDVVEGGGVETMLKPHGLIAQTANKKQQHHSFDWCLYDWKIRNNYISTPENTENLNLANVYLHSVVQSIF